MKRHLAAGALTACAALVFTSAAWAHAEISPAVVLAKHLQEFGLLVPASDDKAPERLADAKTLMEMSTQASKTGHPAVFMLYPNSKPAAMPQLVDKGSNTWVLNWKADAKAEGQKAELGFGLTLIGHTTAE